MLTVDTSDWKKLERQLNTFRSKALPYATREMVNKMAFEAQSIWRTQTLKEQLHAVQHPSGQGHDSGHRRSGLHGGQRSLVHGRAGVRRFGVQEGEIRC